MSSYGEAPYENSAYWEGLAEYFEEAAEKQYWKDLENRVLDPSEYNTIEEPMAHEHSHTHKPDPAHELLHLPIGENGADAATVGEYLGLLLSNIWIQEAGFSGKRPFGDSGWQYDIYVPMAKAGLIEMVLDEDGYVESFSDSEQIKADELILQAIRKMYHG